MNMIEKVAKALYHSKHGKHCKFELLSRYFQLKYSKDAKAAIEAMREPTEEMIHCKGPFYSIKEQYQAMIDAALKET